jgi:hypothetical protein
MEGLTTIFFKNLYTVEVTVQPEEVIELFQPVITDEMNMGLCKEFSPDDISNALFQIGPLKAPGLDGFLHCFSKGTGTLCIRMSLGQCSSSLQQE